MIDLDNLEETTIELGYRQRYFIHMAYDGSNYYGWQNQLSVVSVQEKVEAAISKIMNVKTGVVGCGRTDTGVHATNYYAHFDCFKALPDNFLFKLNNVLPNDIVFFDIWAVHADANARFDATEREYDYHLHFKKDPFLRKFSTEYRFSKPNFELMNECAALLLNYRDFKPLSKFNPDNKTTICQLTKCAWIQTGLYSFKLNIAANRFLHNMVRRIVGTLMAIGEGKLSKEEFIQIMDSVGEFTKVQKAVAQGLHLVRVKYPFID